MKLGSGEAKYIRKEDVSKPVLVTVDRFGEEKFKERDGSDSVKDIVFFKELVKGLVLNADKKKVLCQAAKTMPHPITGEIDVSKMPGIQVVLYIDPLVEYPRGTIVGGLRLRLTKQQMEQDDDVPF